MLTVKAVKDIIREKRLEHNLTMKELARKVGVSEGTVSRWESGEIVNMRRNAVAALSCVLEIPLEVLTGQSDGDIKKTMAERLKEVMVARDLRQSDLVELTGLGKSAISQYLSGKVTPKQDKVFRLARAINVSPEWLLGYVENEEANKLYDIARRLKPEDVQILIRIAKSLLAEYEKSK